MVPESCHVSRGDTANDRDQADKRKDFRMPNDANAKETDVAGSPGSHCSAVLFHGPGHQSQTRCNVKGPHITHAAVYGRWDQYATWHGDKAFTGVFDDPVCVDE